ncbi:MAG: InlB B-repeat-containing protein [Lachnospiraceae bacterium]|nr:InlB B-repeat-containing protein [Lachnospiraceae bacterium]
MKRIKQMTAKVLIAAMLAGSFSVQADTWNPRVFAQMGESRQSASPGDAETKDSVSLSTGSDAETATGSNAGFSWEEIVDGYSLHFQAEKGDLPEDVNVSVEVVDCGDYQLSDSDQNYDLNAEIEKIAAFDIRFQQNGEQIHPNKTVHVSIGLNEVYLDTKAYAAFVEGENLSVLKLDDVSDETVDFTIRESGIYQIGWLIEEDYPAFSCVQTIDGVQINIQAEEGVLPEGTEVVITPVQQSEICDLVSADEGEELLAFDIQFVADGEEIQPLSDVKVTFTSEAIQKNAEVFHISDENQVETVENTADEDGTAEFLAEHFSVYGIRQAAGYSAGTLSNPVYGGTADGDWKGNYVYYGWDNYEGNQVGEHYPSMKKFADSLNMYSPYTWNGEKFMGKLKRRPVKWRILNNDGNSLLLMADRIMYVHNYSDEYYGIPTWETSTIRKWLRETIIPEMFTEEEQMDLCDNVVTDTVSITSGLENGNSTVDEIFLPSLEDITNPSYGFPENDKSKSRAAEYIISGMDYKNTANDKSYWLRSRGSGSLAGALYPYYVLNNGLCNYGGNRYNTWNLGVRPMIRVAIGSDYLATDETDEKLYYGIQFNHKEKTLAPGDTFVLVTEGIGMSISASELTWGSSDEEVVNVDDQGKITAKSVGEAYIYAHRGQNFAGCKVTVTNEPIKPVKNYTVIFMDGDLLVSSQSVEEGKNATAPVLEKEGYTLSWDKSFAQVSSDLTVNAVWTLIPVKYRITYELNGGVNNIWNPTEYVAGESGPDRVLQKPSRENYKFLGWYTTAEFKKDTAISVIPKTMTGDLVLYAKWYRLFNAELDGWPILNSRTGLGYKREEGISMYQDVYKDIYLSYLYSITASNWNGSCFGLSATAVADYLGIVNMEDYINKEASGPLYSYGYNSVQQASDRERGGNVYSIKGNNALRHFIERWHISQRSKEMYDCEVFEDDLYFDELINFLNSDMPRPLVVSMHAGSPHAVVTDTSVKPYHKENDDWYYIKLYDSDNPVGDHKLENPNPCYQQDPSYLAVNVENGKWQYWVGKDLKTYADPYQYYSNESLGGELLDGLKSRSIQFFDLKDAESITNSSLTLALWDELLVRVPKAAQYTLESEKGQEYLKIRNNQIIGCSEDATLVPICNGEEKTDVDVWLPKFSDKMYFKGENISTCLYTEEGICFIETSDCVHGEIDIINNSTFPA